MRRTKKRICLQLLRMRRVVLRMKNYCLRSIFSPSSIHFNIEKQIKHRNSPSSIHFYASSKEKAYEFFEDFENKRKSGIPSAVKCLRNSLNSCLKDLDFPEEEWISLRTTNIIERLNKEFKRRTKPMKIVAGERAWYRLLPFICLKMELNLRTSRMGKVRKNLPFFSQFNLKWI